MIHLIRTAAYTRVMVCAVILLGFPGQKAPGQFISNPSFEGTPGIGSCPPTWEPLDIFSTPDTEPLPCDTYSAAHGNTYLTLVTRGPGRQFEGTSENVVTELSESLQPGRYYRLTIDLASRDDLGHFSWEEGFVAYTSTAMLKVYGSAGPPARGILLAETGAVTNQSWSTYNLILNPLDACGFLILEAGQVFSDPGSANLLLDHLRLEMIDGPPLEYGELEVPNAFTPNGDGTNDSFMIRGLAPGSYLAVFDRSGKEVFSSDDYRHSWEGKDREGRDLPEGTYWYVLFPSGEDRAVKGFIYLKRE